MSVSWVAILREAITTPGLIHEAYSRFHRFSVRNRLLAMSQCAARDLTPGPLATFKQWAALGRHVQRGEKAIVLRVPITVKSQPSTDEDAETEPTEDRVFFTFRARWFLLSQTTGAEYEPVSAPTWREERMLEHLGIRMVPFEVMNGNVQGYANADGTIAISPVAALPHKTLFHEVAHVLLHHVNEEKTPKDLREVEAEGVALLCCEALGLEGAAYARGYLQRWLGTNELTSETTERIITTATTILNAGAQETTEVNDPPVVAADAA